MATCSVSSSLMAGSTRAGTAGTVLTTGVTRISDFSSVRRTAGGGARGCTACAAGTGSWLAVSEVGYNEVT